MKKLIYNCIILGFICGCGSGGDLAPDQLDMPLKIENDTLIVLEKDAEHIKALMSMLAQPMEMASIIQEIGARIVEEDLITKDSDDLTSAIEKAIYLGGYSVDFASLSLNGLSRAPFGFMQQLSALTEELYVDQFFDYSAMELFAKRNQIDSLIAMATNSLDNMEHYLIIKDRNEINVAILIGGWAESMYLSAIHLKLHPNNDGLKQFICQQRETIFHFIQLLGFYPDHTQFQKMTGLLAPIVGAFKPMKEIQPDKGEVTYGEINGERVAQQDLNVVYDIGTSDFKNLLVVLQRFRNEILE